MLACYKLVYKVYLSFAGHFYGLADADVPVGVGDGRFLNLEQPHIHTLLSWHVPARALLLDQITFVAHPLEESSLSDVVTILLDELGEVSNQD